jgi:two-component system cell cycle sensor histidine kinase/response regulator CckA
VNVMPRPQILVVEDEAITALDIKSRLERAGYAVSSIVSSGEEAITTTSAMRPDLVLMDIRLSGNMDGIEAARVIRTSLGTPVIYLTAYADQETLQRAKATEPHGYLLKPFEEREIHTTIEMALYKHEMERKLKESEQCLSTTLRSIGDAVIACDAEACVRFMNPVAESLTGWTESEALGRDVSSVFAVLHEDTGVPLENPVMWAIRENTVIELESGCVLCAADGTLIPIDDSIAPMRDAAGNVIGAVLVFRDITERRRTENALRQHARDLEARNKELDAFAHTVAHDLKDPMNLIIGLADILEEDHTTMSDAHLQDHLHTITQTGLRMNNIIDELLLLAEVRKLDVEQKPLDMRQLVASAQSRLSHMAEAQQGEIICPAEWPLAVGYGPWIEEVWVNYLSNALKYGGQPPRVELGATEQADHIRFWVRDNGPGIAPEDQDRLFTPFNRLEPIRARGHGLGLSVVRRIMNRLGGRAGVESGGLTNEGSLFYFDLPRWGEGNNDPPA